MVELYKTVTDSIGRFVQAWFVPAAIAVGFLALFLFPIVSHKGLFADIDSFSNASKIAVAGFSATVLAFALSATSTSAYRFLEGYYWVPCRARRLQKHRAAWTDLRDKTDQDRGVALSKVRDQLDRYPRHDRNLLPTRLGNLLRGAETYGTDQYGLDTVTLWPQMMTVTDEGTRESLATARSAMDFFLGFVLLAPLLAAASVFAAIYSGDWGALFGLTFLPATVVLYRGLLSAGVGYATMLRGLVDVCRLPLAERLGLELPPEIEAEQELWEAVTGYAAWGPYFEGSDAWTAVIGKHRKLPRE